MGRRRGGRSSVVRASCFRVHAASRLHEGTAAPDGLPKRHCINHPFDLNGPRGDHVPARLRLQDRDGPAVHFVEAAVAWIVLFIAGLFEIIWATAMKQSDGFSRLWPSIITITAMIVSFGLLSWSMRSLPLGTAYTIWTGIGAVGAFAVGVMVLGEAASPLRLLAAFLIVSGILLMKLTSS